MNVYVKPTDYHIGCGVFAAHAFRKGELVLRATGKLIHHQTLYSIQVDWCWHLDPDPPAKYLNHSCNPNVGVMSTASGLPEFYALRDISKDEEITFDYAMTEYMHYPRQNSDEDFDLVCHCKAENCRGRLGYYSELDESLKEQYAGYFADYLNNGKAPIVDYAAQPAGVHFEN